MRIFIVFASFLWSFGAFSQKKPLDHTVYDAWESIAERQLSNNGEWIAFTVTPQEGDGKLMVSKADGSSMMEIPRGYNLSFSADDQFLVFKIKPTFKETRDARIKKKRPDDMPKDSLAWVKLATQAVTKVPRVSTYKMPEEASWLAYHLEKPLPSAAKKPATAKADPKLDSAKKVIDSLTALLNELPAKVRKKYLGADLAENDMADLEIFDAGEADEATNTRPDDGGELVWVDLSSGKQLSFKNITDFSLDTKLGKKLALETGKKGPDSLAKAQIWLVDVASGKVDTIARNINDAKNMQFDETGMQLAFVAEADSSAKALQKFFKLYYYKEGTPEAKIIAHRGSQGKMEGWAISDNASPRFSKSGQRLIFGVAPVLPLKDTTLPEFDRVSVDVWHYNDDYLQPQQLRTLSRTLNRSFTAIYHISSGNLVQLGDETLENIQTGYDMDAPIFVGSDNRDFRVEGQWMGGGRTDIYTVDPNTGKRTMVKKAAEGNGTLSAAGKYVAWYDRKAKQYFTWSDGQIRNISSKVKTALYDEDNDVPNDPGAYGQMAWHDRDEALYVYDRYDIWKLDPAGKANPVCITAGEGRKNKIVIRFQRLDAEEERSISDGQQLMFTLFNEKDKTAGLKGHKIGETFSLGSARQTYPVAISGGSVKKAKNANVLTFGTETFARSGDIKVIQLTDANLKTMTESDVVNSKSLYQPNPQQANYNWMTAELIEWKTYNGKMTQGILYKPEDFDPNKKYPLISYFYETVSDGLYRYAPPSPTPSRLNIPFFVSRGYLVLAPDIRYKTGQPAQDAFDHIVSGVRHVVKMGIADSTRLGIQGQSWGGIQVAQLITMTPLFKAAWAGAPVANMTSAYGGIRWESGVNRQFQYEKTQSRIGATLWERPDLYIKNSPLFHLPKVTTPLVIMHNDADGAVPWYQGIELYTGLRRLGKKVWMLNYNGEAHNLVERRNRKDISIREQQYFDWLLKDEAPAKWITEGVPAVMKGRDWGLAID